ncbi:MAG: hypothetical protein HY606_08960 [Planctomycetes bacterium]|nr:hypothetical protein [Planctomycetota bacterium]
MINNISIAANKIHWLSNPNWLIFLLVIVPLVIIAIFFACRQNLSGTTVKIKLLPLFIRVIFVVSALLLTFHPVAQQTVNIRKNPTAVILIDSSSSMADNGSDNDIKSTAENLIDKLKNDFELKLFSFDAGLKTFRSISEIKFDGKETRLLDSLDHLVSVTADNPPKAFFIISDGLDTSAKTSQDEVLTKLKELKIPFYFFPLGSKPPKPDIELIQADYDKIVRLGDHVQIKLYVNLNNTESAEATFELTQNSGIISSRTIELKKSNTINTLVLDHKPLEPGEHNCRLTVKPIENEINTGNNELLIRFHVYGSQARILYIEGYQRWEFQHLQSLFDNNDTFISATYFVQNSEQEDVSTAEDIFNNLTNYDIVIIGDLNPTGRFISDNGKHPDNNLKKLKSFVENGGSLILLAGKYHTQELLNTAELAELSPVFPDNTDTKPQNDEFTPEQATIGAISPLLRTNINNTFSVIDSSQTSSDQQISFPVYNWHFTNIQQKRSCINLLKLPSKNKYLTDERSNYPLLCYNYYGNGIVMFFGIETWRLSSVHDHDYFKTAWSNIIRFLCKTTNPNDKYLVKTDKDIYETGEIVSIYLKPLEETVLDTAINITSPDGTKIESPLSGKKDQIQTASFFTQKEGNYQIKISDTIAAIFSVKKPDIESTHSKSGEKLLTAIAISTGGLILSRDDFDSTLQKLDKKPIQTSLPVSIELWNNTWIFLLLIALLTIEWIIKRKEGLI